MRSATDTVVSMPKGQYDRATSNWTPTPHTTDPPELVNAVRSAYESGMTMRETAAAVGVSVKVLQRLMPRHGIERRRAVKRNQTGSANANWKGDAACYASLHQRVEKARGRPAACSVCGAAREWIDWANLTGHYEDIDDYAAMCRPCHRAYDAGRRARG
jgi:hypothetical protein